MTPRQVSQLVSRLTPMNDQLTDPLDSLLRTRRTGLTEKLLTLNIHPESCVTRAKNDLTCGTTA